MIQSLRNSLPSLSLQTFSVRQVRDKWAALTPLEQRDLTIKAVSVLVFSLMVFTAAYKLARYCFTPILTWTLPDGSTANVKVDESGKPKGRINKQGKLDGEGEIILIADQGVLKGTFDNGVLVKGKITLANGVTYEGEFKDDQLIKGKKTPAADSEVVYEEGKFQDDQLHGEGKKAFCTGELHTGTFNNGVLVKGKVTLANGDSYEGTFCTGTLSDGSIVNVTFDENGKPKGTIDEQGKLEGEGEIKFSDGSIQRGNFVKGKLDCGTIIQPDDTTAVGQFDTNLRLQGRGRIDRSEDASSILLYEDGEFKDGQLHGQGTRKFRTGELHTGTFDNGALVKGKVTLANGDSYEGDFEDLKLQGKEGKKIVRGVTYEGEFKDDQLIKGKKTPSAGSNVLYEEGEFQDDQLHGEEGTRTFANQVQKGTFNNGQFVKGKITVTNGDFYEGAFGAELKLKGEGTKVVNKIRYEGQFKDGRLLQGKKIPLSGSEISYHDEGEFQDDLLHGQGKREFPNKEVQEGTFENGRFVQGTISCTDGRFYQGTFKNAKLQGKGTKIVSGVTYEGEFKDGELIKETKTTQDGTVTQVGETATT